MATYKEVQESQAWKEERKGKRWEWAPVRCRYDRESNKIFFTTIAKVGPDMCGKVLEEDIKLGMLNINDLGWESQTTDQTILSTGGVLDRVCIAMDQSLRREEKGRVGEGDRDVTEDGFGFKISLIFEAKTKFLFASLSPPMSPRIESSPPRQESPPRRRVSSTDPRRTYAQVAAPTRPRIVAAPGLPSAPRTLEPTSIAGPSRSATPVAPSTVIASGQRPSTGHSQSSLTAVQAPAGTAVSSALQPRVPKTGDRGASIIASSSHIPPASSVLVSVSEHKKPTKYLLSEYEAAAAIAADFGYPSVGRLAAPSQSRPSWSIDAEAGPSNSVPAGPPALSDGLPSHHDSRVIRGRGGFGVMNKDAKLISGSVRTPINSPIQQIPIKRQLNPVGGKVYYNYRCSIGNFTYSAAAGKMDLDYKFDEKDILSQFAKHEINEMLLASSTGEDRRAIIALLAAQLEYAHWQPPPKQQGKLAEVCNVLSQFGYNFKFVWFVKHFAGHPPNEWIFEVMMRGRWREGPGRWEMRAPESQTFRDFPEYQFQKACMEVSEEASDYLEFVKSIKLRFSSYRKLARGETDRNVIRPRAKHNIQASEMPPLWYLVRQCLITACSTREFENSIGIRLPSSAKARELAHVVIWTKFVDVEGQGIDKRMVLKDGYSGENLVSLPISEWQTWEDAKKLKKDSGIVVDHLQQSSAMMFQDQVVVTLTTPFVMIPTLGVLNSAKHRYGPGIFLLLLFCVELSTLNPNYLGRVGHPDDDAVRKISLRLSELLIHGFRASGWACPRKERLSQGLDGLRRNMEADKMFREKAGLRCYSTFATLSEMLDKSEEEIDKLVDLERASRRDSAQKPVYVRPGRYLVHPILAENRQIQLLVDLTSLLHEHFLLRGIDLLRTEDGVFSITGNKTKCAKSWVRWCYMVALGSYRDDFAGDYLVVYAEIIQSFVHDWDIRADRCGVVRNREHPVHIFAHDVVFNTFHLNFQQSKSAFLPSISRKDHTREHKTGYDHLVLQGGSMGKGSDFQFDVEMLVEQWDPASSNLQLCCWFSNCAQYQGGRDWITASIETIRRYATRITAFSDQWLLQRDGFDDERFQSLIELLRKCSYEKYEGEEELEGVNEDEDEDDNDGDKSEQLALDPELEAFEVEIGVDDGDGDDQSEVLSAALAKSILPPTRADKEIPLVDPDRTMRLNRLLASGLTKDGVKVLSQVEKMG
ncbi:hypothetical protein P7C73_g5002, partial [Tremellales sp. Uapishka_1]